MAAPTEQLRTEVIDGVGRIVLNQPEKHNAISYEMWIGLSAVTAEFAADDAVRVVVVTGAGERAFSAGADISQFADKRGSTQAIAEYNRAVKQAYEDLTALPKPTIARVAGYCLGGGLHAALCCDIRIASEDSTFAIPAAKLGLGYGYQALRPLVELVGPSRAKEILYTARRFDAREAELMGLVNKVLPRAELDGYVEDYASRIAANAPLTVRATKRIIAEVQRDPGVRDLALCDRLVDECYASDDYQEGRTAFMEKRKPTFQGR